MRGRSISIMKVARDKLKEIGPDEVNMEEYKVSATFWPSCSQSSCFPKQRGKHSQWETGNVVQSSASTESRMELAEL